MDTSKIRNFCIIAHIDHGKSTLADRMLESTQTVASREMQNQLLDQMDIERERGITIKLQPVRMEWEGLVFNLIDTPGHVDFTYEVSRSLAAVQGAVLLVDASQGVQAQTIANLYLALEQNLTIIPVINKIDLPNADVPRVTAELVDLLGCNESEILTVSAKTGKNISEVLKAISERIPAPKVSKVSKKEVGSEFQALVFDSTFDEFQGVIAYVSVAAGEIKSSDEVYFVASGKTLTASEVGVFKPERKSVYALKAGEIGWVATGLKDVAEVRVGDTISSSAQAEALPGYREVKPMVFAGIFPQEGNDFLPLRTALEKLRLNDAALVFEPEHSPALGYGFRCGFLGLLHLEIVQERLRREYNLEITVTVPSVAYQVKLLSGEELIAKSPQELPDVTKIAEVREPIMKVDIFSPKEYVGAVMQLTSDRRSVYKTTEYLDEKIGVLHYEIPLTALLVDFYDKLKSATAGYASLTYELIDYRPTKIVKLDILVAEEPVESLSSLVYDDEAYRAGRRIVESLKNTMPRQQFALKLQAAIGGKVIAAERLSPLRKDVTAKLYGGDYTRKKKLLEKQKKGKKRLAQHGKVNIPPEAFLAVLKR
ncbi:elongation factor 4 [bacterium]|nr:elongation factor 4 [bacterium]